MDLRQLFGTNVKRAREGAGLSQEELAHRAAIHVTYLSGVENGRRNPSLAIIGRLAAALQVDVADLLSASSRPGR